MLFLFLRRCASPDVFFMAVGALQTRRHMASLGGHADAVMCLSIRNGDLYSGSWDSTVRVWDTRTMTCLRAVQSKAGPIVSIAVSNQTCMAVGVDRVHVIPLQASGAQSASHAPGSSSSSSGRDVDHECSRSSHALETTAAADHVVSVTFGPGPLVRTANRQESFHPEGRLITGYPCPLLLFPAYAGARAWRAVRREDRCEVWCVVTAVGSW